LHPDLKADYILANPPFNMKEWGAAQVQQDVRWEYGTPPVHNANFAWVQHMIHHLAPNGMAGFVLANGSMSAQASGEGNIRKAIVEADLVDCMVALPGQLFYTTQIPVCLWFLARNKAGTDPCRPLRDRRGETLFIDARQMGQLTDRIHRELMSEDLSKIVNAYHAWRGEPDAGDYVDEAGFCYSAKREEICRHDYILTPGRYVGIEDAEEDAEPFEEKVARLTADLEAQFTESAKLEAAIRENLRRLGQV
jgi:type I restriction enzyme M protein